jgi:hypothetical protein
MTRLQQACRRVTMLHVMVGAMLATGLVNLTLLMITLAELRALP